ncbi:MAG: hypothetical protein ACQETI_13485 [Halobacteriota archaeon]
MIRSIAFAVEDGLLERFPETLRSVGYYDDDGGHLLYVRDDVDEVYGRAEREQVFTRARLEAMDRPNQESLYVHGELLCTFRCFEEATKFHATLTDTEGIVAAVDAGGVDDLRGTTDVIRRTVEANRAEE